MGRLEMMGVALAVLLLATGGAAWWGYRAGVAAEHDRQTVAGMNAWAKAVTRAAEVAVDIAEVGKTLAAALTVSREAETRHVQTVRTIIHENPDFAAVRRPAELERLRRLQLEAIAARADADRL